MKKVTKSRSAKTGKFVTSQFAKENPDTTINETIVIPEASQPEKPAENEK